MTKKEKQIIKDEFKRCKELLEWSVSQGNSIRTARWAAAAAAISRLAEHLGIDLEK